MQRNSILVRSGALVKVLSMHGHADLMSIWLLLKLFYHISFWSLILISVGKTLHCHNLFILGNRDFINENEN